MMDWRKKYDEMAARVDVELKQILADETTLYPLMRDAMAYSLFAGGKRLRAVLLLSAASLFLDDLDTAYPFAAAIEMIHTYSLIHDDLPAMDDDDYRRGNPTSHKVFGEANAILAGDALLNMAYEVMSQRAWEMANAGDLQGLAALRLIARQAGASGMIAGQTADIENEKNLRSDEKTLYYIHTHKTGALIEAAVASGATLGDARLPEQHALMVYASQFGLAFQIIDDILDETGKEEELGKSIGKDRAAEKLTFVQLYGLEKSQEYAKVYIQRAMDALAPFGARADFLREMAWWQLRRTH